MNDIGQLISRLEGQKATLERAIAALREIEGNDPRRLSSSGRPKQAASLKKTPSSTAKEPSVKAGPVKRGLLTDAGRKKLSLAAKKRWALAKRKGLNAITGKPLSKA